MPVKPLAKDGCPKFSLYAPVTTMLCSAVFEHVVGPCVSSGGSGGAQGDIETRSVRTQHDGSSLPGL